MLRISAPTAALQADEGENSIMQTISIAVSAILIAAGLITAPSLINNARDVNAKTDLANLATAQEVALADSGEYANGLDALKAATDGSRDSDLGALVKYTTSLTGNALNTVSCKDDDGDWHYVSRATSASGKPFWRTDASTRIYTTAIDISEVLPSCLTPEQIAEIGAAPVGGGSGTDAGDGAYTGGAQPDLDFYNAATTSASGFMSNDVIINTASPRGNQSVYSDQSNVRQDNLDGSALGLTSHVNVIQSSGSKTVSGDLLVGSTKVGSFDHLYSYMQYASVDGKYTLSSVSVGGAHVDGGLSNYAQLFGGTGKIRIGSDTWPIGKVDKFSTSGYTAGSHTIRNEDAYINLDRDAKSLIFSVNFNTDLVAGSSLSYFAKNEGDGYSDDKWGLSTAATIEYNNGSGWVKASASDPVIRLDKDPGDFARLNGSAQLDSVPASDDATWRITIKTPNGDTYVTNGNIWTNF